MNIFFTFNIKDLVMFNSSLLIIVFIADFIRNKRYFKATHYDLKNSYSIFLKYIDRYYITNLTYTILASIMYIICTIILFLGIRYLFIGQISLIMRVDTSIIAPNYEHLMKLVFKYLLFLLSIYFYKILLQILFYKEIIKLRIYLQKYYESTIDFSYYCRFFYGEYICKLIWILSYRITTQTFNDNLFEGEFEDWKDQLLDYDEYDYYDIYNNIYLNKIVKYLMYISAKSVIITTLFYYNAKIFKIISRHSSYGLFKFAPHMLLIICLLYDINKGELYLIYYSTFCYFIYHIISGLRKFEQNIDFICIQNLKDYFYENDFAYSAQRLYIINSENYSINKNSRQNDVLASSFKNSQEAYDNDLYMGIIYSILNNIVNNSNPNMSDNNSRRIHRQSTFLYLRATIVVATIIINIFIIKTLNIKLNILNISISTLSLFGLSLIMIIVASKILYSTVDWEFDKIDTNTKRNYNYKYSIIFWILTLLQCYIYWLLIVKPALTFMSTDVLIELPYNILTVIRIYSQEEKIMYLYQYFEFYASLQKSLGNLNDDYLRHIIRQIDYKDLITFETSLKDLQIYIKLLFDNYYLDETFNYIYKKKMIEEHYNVMQEIYYFL